MVVDDLRDSIGGDRLDAAGNSSDVARDFEGAFQTAAVGVEPGAVFA
jgi:hypothetical protein